MSLLELYQAYPLHLRRRVSVRSINKSVNRNQRLVSRKFSRTKTKSLAALRSQYYLNIAFRDARLAISRNEDIFITSLMITALLSFALISTGSEFLMAIFGSATVLADSTNLSAGVLMLIAFAVPTVLVAWLLAFLLNLTSFTLMDGANGKLKRSVRTTVRRALRYASRVTNAWLAFALLFGGPILFTFISFYLYKQVAHVSKAATLAALPYAAGTAAAWVAFTIANYGLVPHVALFEPAAKLTSTFARSRRLVSSRGRLFTLAIYILVAAGIGTSVLLGSLSEHYLHLNSIFVGFIGVLASLLTGHCLMTMLYRKRKLARS